LAKGKRFCREKKSEEMKKETVLITGGAGFIGSYMARRLLSENYKVVVADNLFTGKEENIPKGADFLKLDLGDRAAYNKLKDLSCEAVFHLAGQSSGEISFKDPVYDFNSHVMSTFLLLEWCRKRAVKRFIYASSMATYGDPDHLPIDEDHPQRPKTFYAAAKMSAEAYIKLFQTLGIDTTIMRLFSVYGPGQNLENKLQGIASIYLSYMLEGAPIFVRGSKDRFRDLVYITDVVDAWMAAFKNRSSFGRTYNVASGVKTKVEDLVEALRSAFGDKDYPVKYSKESTPGDQFGVVADIKRIKGDLGWKPNVSLDEGIKKMVDFEKTRAGKNG